MTEKESWELVGRFLWAFAETEASLNVLVAKLFDLNTVSSLILMSNIDFRKKVSLARVGTQNSGSPLFRGDHHNKTWSGLNELANARNILAHSPFFPEGGGVKFLHVVAKEKLTFPPSHWSVEFFQSKFDQAHRLATEIDAITEHSGPITDPASFRLLLGGLGGLGGHA